tara:strand:- start:1471 stop:1572 length:102 start_codon:yes stop_codon:yes gene_type:complete
MYSKDYFKESPKVAEKKKPKIKLNQIFKNIKKK